MKTIRKNLLLLAFAAGALFLIGNNVFAGEDPNESEDSIGGTITCNQSPGYMAQCWYFCPATFSNTGVLCVWSGNMYHFCYY